VRVLGGVGIVNGVSEMHVESAGKEQRFTVRYLAVYAKAGSVWRMSLAIDEGAGRLESDLHQVPADDDRALEVLAHALGPHLVGDRRVVARNEVRQHERLDLGLGRDPAHVFGDRVAIEITPPGDPEPARSAPGADLRTDVPGYRIYRKGELAEQRADIRDVWRDDLVAFLLGCSFTFEHALVEAGVPPRNVELDTKVSMFISNIACVPAGRFYGPIVVTMRPIPEARRSCSRAVSPLPTRPRRAGPRRRLEGDWNRRPEPT
jgi:hypothetical protein